MATSRNNSKYDPDLHPTLIRWLARGGRTNAQITQELGIGSTTLQRWIKKHAEVAQAIREGRDYIDAMVEETLLKRALGYDVEQQEVRQTTTEATDAAAPRGGKTVRIMRKVRRHIPADVRACIFWMINRQSKQWREKPPEVDRARPKALMQSIKLNGTAAAASPVVESTQIAPSPDSPASPATSAEHSPDDSAAPAPSEIPAEKPPANATAEAGDAADAARIVEQHPKSD